MLDRLLPLHADNTYRGSRIAIWFLAILVIMRTVISVNSIVNGYDVASKADGIPLATYSPAAARTAVALFALLGLSNLMICLIAIVVLLRYRALIPLMFSVMLLQHLVGRAIHVFLPTETTGTPPGFYINLGLLVLMALGLIFSVVAARTSTPAAAAR